MSVSSAVRTGAATTPAPPRGHGAEGHRQTVALLDRQYGRGLYRPRRRAERVGDVGAHDPGGFGRCRRRGYRRRAISPRVVRDGVDRLPARHQDRPPRSQEGHRTPARALRTRLARRFSIFGSDDNFQLFVGDREVTVADRGYFHRLQYVWVSYADAHAARVIDRCTNAEHMRGPRVHVPGGTEDGPGPDGGVLLASLISGWIGTALTAGSLKAAIHATTSTRSA